LTRGDILELDGKEVVVTDHQVATIGAVEVVFVSTNKGHFLLNSEDSAPLKPFKLIGHMLLPDCKELKIKDG
jgi:hypothetical protein